MVPVVLYNRCKQAHRIYSLFHLGHAATGAPDLLVAAGWGLGAVPLELPSISPAHHTLLRLAIVGYTFYRRAIKIAILAL